MNTHHQYLYLDSFPVDPGARAIIIGTIHPHERDEFVMDFFYGSRCSIWTILAEAFPGKLQDPTLLIAVRQFLARYNITMSYTIRSCQRLTNTALDAHLMPPVYNTSLVEQIKNSSIEQVFFTSGASKNCALRTFYTGVLKYKYLPTIVAKSKMGHLPVDIFGRKIGYTVLYSPATTADRGIKKSKRYKDALLLYRTTTGPPMPIK